MAGKTTNKTKTIRVSASSVVTEILGRARVPTDEAIISEVKKRVKGTGFDKTQLAWYKSRYRQGLLPKMNGKKHLIRQAQPHKAAGKSADVTE